MSRRKNKTGAKKRRCGKVTKLPVRQTSSSERTVDRKLSEIIKEMAMRLLKKPDADAATEPATMAVLILASVAWNSAIGDSFMRDKHRELVDQIDWSGVPKWSELRSDDTEQLIAELVDYKREHYPNDLRRVVATEMSPEGNIRVYWTEPDKVVTAPFGAARSKAMPMRAKRRGPIAAYEHHMKFGLARDYWTEFVFEAYVNHRSDVNFLKGLPDVPESRPHSSVNS